MTTQGFLKELQRLIDSKSSLPSRIIKSENCEYGDYIYNSKNLQNCFDCAKCSDSLYLYDSYMCTNCIDCDYTVESQVCYECVDAFKCYNCEFLENCDYMRDSSYCYGSSNCHDVLGCVNLKNKSFCIFNRQLTENEYKEAIKKLKLVPIEKILIMLEELKKQFPLTQTHEEHNENSPYGNYIYYNNNCYLCFDASYNEYCGYLYDSFHNKTCYDLTYSVQSELAYQVIDSEKIFNCNFVVYSNNCQDGSFLFNCFDVKKSLGCVGLSHKQYCILNRQFAKEEYEKISSQILLELKNKNINWNNLTF